ncbi:MAG: type II toxin-antitoxin system VapC family toxin [Thermomicrobiales bacterium]|nr:type II toxin-antitoxin system VapC family toxin [Thermomicrobiales bacterium]
MKYLIDSDVIVSHLNGKTAMIDLIERLLESGIAISLMSYAEIYEGILWHYRPSNLERPFLEFLRWARVLGFDEAMMKQFAAIRGGLRRGGMPLPDADLLIATTAMHYDLTLVTRNLKHFDRIEGLQLFSFEHMDR